MRLREDAILRISAALNLKAAAPQLIELLQDRTRLEEASLVAYGIDLESRQKGFAEGPAILALWRSFAWNENGSPKRNFQLTAGLILEAESRLTRALLKLG